MRLCALCATIRPMTKREEENNENTHEEYSDEDARVYEIGFHLVPSLSEDEVEKEVTSIKEVIEMAGGSFIAEGYPNMRALEYTIEVADAIPKTRYDHAQFGWIKFEGDPSLPDELYSQLSTDANIIRMLVIKTVRENTLYGPKLRQQKKEEEEREQAEDPGEDTDKGSDSSDASDEDIDKSIEELVIN